MPSHLNGQVYQVIPGRLLIFPTPAGDLPVGQHWADADCHRTFAPSFYADLFGHLGVSTVLRLDAGADYDPAAFLAAGIAVADVTPAAPRPDPAAAATARRGAAAEPPPPSLATLDRLVRLMDSARGLVAVHFSAADAGARALVAAYIARRARPPPAAAPPSSPGTRRRRDSPPAAAAASEGGFEADEAVAWLHVTRPYPVGGWRRTPGPGEE